MAILLSHQATGSDDWAETAVNVNWRLRYDHFFDPANAFFLGHRGRVDRFAGIRPRLSLNFGYTRILFEEPQHDVIPTCVGPGISGKPACSGSSGNSAFPHRR